MAITSEIRWARRAVVYLVVLVVALGARAGLCAATASAASAPISTLHIHKLEQPNHLGRVAEGLSMDTSGMTPVPGAEFTVKPVPGARNTVSIAEARKVAGKPAISRMITDGNGNAAFPAMQPGLYLIQEPAVPAGYTAAEPFLVSLPLKDPSQLNRWLSEVHVYPKNVKVGIALQVDDEDAGAIGDQVPWPSASTIGLRRGIDAYRIEHKISSNLDLVSTSARNAARITVRIPSGPPLNPGEHYDLRVDKEGTESDTIQVDFRGAGLRALEDAVSKDPGAQVHVGYTTTVRGDGIHKNTAVLYPVQRSIDLGQGIEDSAETRWGSISVLVHKENTSDERIPGAKFQLFTSPGDVVSGRNPLNVSGTTEWSTDNDGQILIKGPRFSNHSNGLECDATDELYGRYWAVPTHLPQPWEWLDARPQCGTVKAVEKYQTLTFEARTDSAAQAPEGSKPEVHPGLTADSDSAEEHRLGPDGDRDGVLAITGVQILGLVLLGIVLVIAGALMMWRRRTAEESEQE